MDHMRALAVKSSAGGLPMVLILSTIGRMNPGESVIIAVVVTFFAYTLGDLWVLPRSNNLVATLADAGLVAFTLWAFGALGLGITRLGLISSVIGLSIAEGLFFHPYLHREVRKDTIIIPGSRHH